MYALRDITVPKTAVFAKTVYIRRLQRGDAAALAAFYNGLSSTSKRTFAPLGPAATAKSCGRIVRDNVREPGRRFDLVAVEGKHIVGWCFLWEMQTDRPTFGLGIADAYHGRKLGSRLMDAVMAQARRAGKKEVYLTVVTDNDRAWRMYERRGFKRCGEHVNSAGVPHYEMLAKLDTYDKEPANAQQTRCR